MMILKEEMVDGRMVSREIVFISASYDQTMEQFDKMTPTSAGWNRDNDEVPYDIIRRKLTGINTVERLLLLTHC